MRKIIGSWILLQCLVACALPHASQRYPDDESSPEVPDDEQGGRDAADVSPLQHDDGSSPVDRADVSPDVVADGMTSDFLTIPDGQETGTDAPETAVTTPDASGPDAGPDSSPDVGCGAGIDPQWNTYNCGLCGVSCLDVGGRELCQGGQCHLTAVNCGGSDPACRSCATDVDCLGYAAPGLQFNHGNGANAHPHCCNGICSPAGDPSNCGGCGNACAAGQACAWQSGFDDEVSCF